MSPTRRTSARRRMKRYRAKRTWKTIPERLKRLIVEPPYHMPTEWELTEPTFVYCETPTMLLLEALGVNEMLWPYYIGFMKRLLALFEKFTEGTLQLEITSLIAEYVLRGYDEEVLDEIQLVVEDCAEACYLSCEIVKACLEGDYSSYSVIASFDDAHAVAQYMFQDAVFNSAEDKIVLLDAGSEVVKSYDIPTLVLGAAIAADLSYYNSAGSFSTFPKKSVLGTYVVVLGYSFAWNQCDRIRIIKNGVQIQTLDDTALGLNNNTVYNVAISRSGKYIIVSGERTASGNMGWVLLEGSA